jgi:hypothetical protein
VTLKLDLEFRPDDPSFTLAESLTRRIEYVSCASEVTGAPLGTRHRTKNNQRWTSLSHKPHVGVNNFTSAVSPFSNVLGFNEPHNE